MLLDFCTWKVNPANHPHHDHHVHGQDFHQPRRDAAPLCMGKILRR